MSAIAGIINFDQRPVLEDDLKRMMAALRYWGPDDERIWRRDSAGMCYLQRKINPEEDFDRQPYVDTERGIVLTSSARLDNRPDLCDKLRIPHPERVSLPDSALIARSYEKWGEQCPEHLLGEFAFALLDGRSQRLFLARDHLGKTPLYYFKASDYLAFATQPKGLFGLPGIPRRLNETFLTSSLFQGARTDPAACFYRDIHRVPAAHSLSIAMSGEEIRLREYWNLDQIPALRFQSDEEYYERFRELFFEAVRCRLRTNHPVGIMLSGGLDSAAVACVAARILKAENRELTAFSFVPPHGSYGDLPSGRIGDESTYVEAIRAQEDNLEVVYERAENLSISDRLDWFFRVLEQPPAHGLWMFDLFELGEERQVRTMLTGQMGNVSISFDGTGYHAELFYRRMWITLWQQLSLTYPDGGKRFWRDLLRAFSSPVRNRLRPKSFQAPRSRFVRSTFLDRGNLSEVLPTQRPHQNGKSARDVLLRTWDYRRRNIRREVWAAMAAPFGMHSTDPTSDKRIVEFCLAIPGHIYKNNGLDRLLVRRGLAGVLPPLIQERADRGLLHCDLMMRMQEQREELARALGDSGTSAEYLDLGEIQIALSETSMAISREDHARALELMAAIGLGRFLLWNEKALLT